MEIGLALPHIDDPEPFRQQVRTAERLGIHALWTYDSGRGADPFASSGYLAAVTSRVQICCGILNPQSVPAPSRPADQRSRHRGPPQWGRCRLVVGLGWAPVVERVFGVVRPRPFRDSQENHQIFKRLLRGEEVTHRAASFSLFHA